MSGWLLLANTQTTPAQLISAIADETRYVRFGTWVCENAYTCALEMPPTKQERSGTITLLIRDARAGDASAWDRLFRVVYPDLKQLAQSILARRARAPGAPKATTLVQDACRRLLERDAFDAASRRHFFRLFCRAMEDEWVERARHDLAVKRQPKGVREPLTDFVAEIPSSTLDFSDLRVALHELSGHDAEAAEVVALRFYCGATLQETAGIMGSTLAVVRRNWSYAKAWLHERLTRDPS
ncbi:MAG: ECF-type sigma factor [Phycisphaerae bacterium]